MRPGSQSATEASAFTHAEKRGFLGRRSPLVRLQKDERLVAMVREGNPGAFEVIVDRYQGRLHGFCRQMLRSTEDAEDVLQEVFVNAYKAMIADRREINLRPWLYRIARNRCLNHLRKPVADARESMDLIPINESASTAEKVHNREEFRQLLDDVGKLPETQRTALLLREMDSLSYEEIAETMDTTVPSVKSLLVRARMSLSEASEARLLTCGEVRVSLAEAAEGITKVSAPVRRHVRECEECERFRKQIRSDSKAFATIFPAGPLLALKAFLIGKLGGLGGTTATGGSCAVGGSAATGACTAGGTAAGAGAAGAGAAAAGAAAISAGGGAMSSAMGAKAVAGVVTAAVITAGAVEVGHNRGDEPVPPREAAVVRTEQPPAPPSPLPSNSGRRDDGSGHLHNLPGGAGAAALASLHHDDEGSVDEVSEGEDSSDHSYTDGEAAEDTGDAAEKTGERDPGATEKPAADDGSKASGSSASGRKDGVSFDPESGVVTSPAKTSPGSDSASSDTSQSGSSEPGSEKPSQSQTKDKPKSESDGSDQSAKDKGDGSDSGSTGDHADSDSDPPVEDPPVEDPPVEDPPPGV